MFKIECPMKKLLLLLVLFSTVKVISQAITVDTSTYTVPQLVNNVLINSPCINANNITWRTGTNFGSSNGIGYFNNTNPNFPMTSGVLLSTGSASQASGPNSSLLSSGSNTWTGDSDLEATLAAAGINMNSVNATSLEFDFVPLSPNFDFDFLFASEEYGNFQCQYSDAFAFLLTNLNTGVTTNLAVVPGSNTPISVVTIRDFLYNSTCPSANEQYFGSFNGGNNAASSATNFNGQTVVLNASSILVPNTPYRIKLVIADRGDYKSDSAIFISSNSFNIGQDVLGRDLLASKNTALCAGVTKLFDTGLDPAIYSFVWKKDGLVMAGQNGPTLTVNQPGTYQLTYTNIAFPCQTITNEVVVEYYPVFNTGNPKNIYKCDSGQATYTFDLSYNTPFVKTGLNINTTVAYFSSIADANANINALPLSYTSSLNQTVYVRINNIFTGCFTVKSFQLLPSITPVATQIPDYVKCIGSNGKANFLLANLTTDVLNGLSNTQYKVTYYKTLINANSSTSAITGISSATNTVVYIRIQLITDPDCFTITTANLIPKALLPVDVLENVLTCTNYVLQPLVNGNYFTSPNGTGIPLFAGNVITQTSLIYIYNGGDGTTNSCPNESSFKVTIIQPDNTIVPVNTFCGSYKLPAITDGEYHTAPNGGGMNLPGGTVITTSQTIYFYYVSTTPPFCVIDLPTNFVIIPWQNVPLLPNAFDCNAYVLQPLSFGNYYDGPDGTGNQIPAGTAITTSKTIFIHAENGICKSDSSFQVVIGLDFPTTTTECSSYILPPLTVGNYYTGPAGTGTKIPAGTEINSTQTIYVYAIPQSLPNCTDNYNFTVTIKLPVITPPSVNASQNCDNFVLQPISIGNYYTGSGGTGNIYHAGDVLTNSQTLYIYLNNNNGCENEITYDVVVNHTPVIDSRSTIDACHSYILTNLTQGNYYTGTAGTGTKLSGGDVLTNSQLVYIYASNNGCSAESSFQVNVFTTSAYQAQNITVCDSYILPTLPGNNKYYTKTGGQFGTGTELSPGTIINSTKTIFVFIESAGRINCTDETNFTVTIIPTPIVGTFPNVKTCNSYILPPLTVGDYYTQTNKGGSKLNAGDLITSSQTIYVYAETGTTSNCFNEKSFSITIFNVDVIQNTTICNSYTLPTLVHGNYYNGPNGTGGMIAQGSVVHSTKTLYIYANSGFNPNCSDESMFTVTIVPEPIANIVPTVNRTVCDDDGINDGIYNFNLNSLNSIILGTQTGSTLLVNYYLSMADATTNTNPVTKTTNTIVYVKVSNSLAQNCFDIKPITITVNKLPEPKPQNGIICIASTTGHLINPYMIYSGLSTTNYTFKWFNQQGQLVGTNADYKAILPGKYSVIATNILTGCASAPAFANVSPSEPAIVSYEVGGDFTETQSITVTAIGTGGDYEYQLDNGLYQDSSVFENVTSGLHILTVRDKNGCGITTKDAIVINYPHYFTPNGDGLNDTWNIKDLKDQPISIIYIFDRYGKLIKKVRPSSDGWDGTYDNTSMPSDDYWFSINYQKNGEEKEFKAHFALKR